MKGLRSYIKKHGKHFTEKLAYDAVLDKRWDRKQIESAFQKRAWYNVTGSTIGDIIYLINNSLLEHGSRSKCITYTLLYIEDYRNYGGKLFDEWLREVKINGNFDFTPYI